MRSCVRLQLTHDPPGFRQALSSAAVLPKEVAIESVNDLMKRGFLIDMDGVVYRGADLIPGADVFIQRLLREKLPFLFLTNNSQRTRRDVATRLSRMGIAADEIFPRAPLVMRIFYRIDLVRFPIGHEIPSCYSLGFTSTPARLSNRPPRLLRIRRLVRPRTTP